MCAIYIALAVLYSLRPTLSRDLIHQAFLWPAVGVLIWLFLQTYVLVSQGHTESLSWLVGCAALFALIAMLVRPFDSRDLYNYVNVGWRQYGYGLNPYTSVSADIAGWQHDPMFLPYWAYTPNPYSFLFATIAHWACALSGGSLARALLVFKSINVLAWAGTAALIGASAQAGGVRRVELALFAFLWNPLIVLTQLVDGHNDILMAFFVMLAMYAALSERYLLVIPALTAAVLIKYVAVVMLPFAVVLIARRRGLGAALASLALGMLLLVVIAAPYLPYQGAFSLGFQGATLAARSNSLESVIFYTYEGLARVLTPLRDSVPLVSIAIKAAAWAVALSLLSVQGLMFVLTPELSAKRFIRVALFSAMVVVFVGSSKFYCWYVAMFYPVALLLEEGEWMRELMIAISVAQLFGLTALEGAHVISVLVMTAAPMLLVGIRHWPTIRTNLAGRWPDEAVSMGDTVSSPVGS